MKYIRRLVEKFYWLAVSAIPLLPAYAYGEYPSVRNCNLDEICFRTGGAILNGEVEIIIYMTALALWPLCAWNILGRHVVPWRIRISSYDKPIIKKIAFFSEVVYWAIVAAIPVLFWYMFATFLAPHDCNLNRSCFQFYVPLTMESKIAVLIACCMLWSLSAWRLVGRLRGRKA